MLPWPGRAQGHARRRGSSPSRCSSRPTRCAIRCLGDASPSYWRRPPTAAPLTGNCSRRWGECCRRRYLPRPERRSRSRGFHALSHLVSRTPHPLLARARHRVAHPEGRCPPGLQPLYFGSPARCCCAVCAYLVRLSPGLWRVPFVHRDDPARFLGEAMARELKEQVEAGTWWRDDRAGVYRPRFTSAWVMTWQALPPFSLLRRWRLRRRASAILQELNMAGPDPRPIAQPRTRVSLGWVAAAAVIVFLVTQLGSRVRHTSWTLPSNFAAPAAFPDAVRALAQLSGGRATPLVTIASVAASGATDGLGVNAPAA